MVRILGIDPGSHKTGWGVIDVQGTRYSRVASGTIVARGEQLGERLVLIAEGLERVLAEHRPRQGALEAIFHAKNSQSALKLGHARGVAMLALARAGLEIGEYSPSRVKQAVTGTGRAAKEQVAKMVHLLLGGCPELGLDESDALAVAICHGQFYESSMSRVSSGLQRGG
jgi:crossover junction endodeoxyribonuclease RuvC